MPVRRGDDPVPLCGSDDLAIVVNWQRDGTGLRGHVIAENVSDHTCQLANKPTVTPLQADGSPLPVDTIITLEMRTPGYVNLEPGQRAAALVLWASWCGQQASNQALVKWPGGSAIARVDGPTQPACGPSRAYNITSSWFNPIKGPAGPAV
jgi:hypothetical protein